MTRNLKALTALAAVAALGPAPSVTALSTVGGAINGGGCHTIGGGGGMRSAPRHGTWGLVHGTRVAAMAPLSFQPKGSEGAHARASDSQHHPHRQEPGVIDNVAAPSASAAAAALPPPTRNQKIEIGFLDYFKVTAPAPSPSPKAEKNSLGFLALAPKKGREGTILLSWGAAAMTMCMQVVFTNWDRLGMDSQAFWDFMCSKLAVDSLFLDQLASADLPAVALYVFMWVNIVGFLFVMPNAFPPQQSDDVDSEGNTKPMEVPHRSRQQKVQHKLTNVDCSYILLNTLTMPGFFYHFFCLLRSWGLSLESLSTITPGAIVPAGAMGLSPLSPTLPPIEVDVDATFAAMAMVSEALPEAVGALVLYFMAYELVYYRWHRSLHEVPFLYKWVHKHHHQQTYPDRPALDTLNTACVESCVGTYMQLGVLWFCGEYLGVKNVPAGIMFFELAGWLSVLEHDKFERALPFGMWKANEHHMHHAFVKCNYAPYSALWDKVFGTWKPFKQTTAEAQRAAKMANMASMGNGVEVSAVVSAVSVTSAIMQTNTTALTLASASGEA